MKKRSCRMTSEEKAVHEFAVKVRKMTDRQLYDFVNEHNEDSNKVSDFLGRLGANNVKGVGPATFNNIKQFAIKEGFVVGN